MITGQGFVCLSTQDWTDLWTRKQRFMQQLARQGNRVLYVELEASLVSLGIIRRDPARAWRFLAAPREVEPDLYVATLPLVLPGFQMSLAINAVNNFFLAPLLRRWLRMAGITRPVLWTYTPYSESLVGRLGERFAIYDCVDEFTASRGLVRPAVVGEEERRLLDRVALTVVTHENLRRSKARPGRPIHLIPNGAQVDHFAAASLAETPIAADMVTIPHPVVGFLGSVQYWIDFDLLRYLAAARPSWSFVLIGPVGRLANVSAIERLPNVHVLGRRQYAQLPSYLKAFDVCLNPYVIGELADNCSPLKLYEYLATGKPIVSVNMPAARAFGDLVSIGTDYAGVLARLDDAIAAATTGDDRAAGRIDAARAHSWINRFRALEAVLEPLLADSPPRG